MTTYNETAKFTGIRSKIDETDMLINAHRLNGNDEMVEYLKTAREYLVELLKNLDTGNADRQFKFSFESNDDIIFDSDEKYE